MAEYQNIFTAVQVRAPLCRRADQPAALGFEQAAGSSRYWLGQFGDAQIGPFYLGSSASLR